MTRPRRLSRGQAQGVTRTRLVQAAGRAAAREGLRGVVLDAIAADAGVTTGAIYSNFTGKAALLDAVADAVLQRRAARDRALLVDGEAPTLQQRADTWLAGAGARQDDLLLFIDLWSEAVRGATLREPVLDAWRDLRRGMRMALEAEAARLGVRLPRAAANDLAMVALALAHGMALEKTLSPRAVPDGIFGLALALLFRGLGAGARPA